MDVLLDTKRTLLDKFVRLDEMENIKVAQKVEVGASLFVVCRSRVSVLI